MSWQATALVAELVDGITRSEKMLMLCLANRHNSDTNNAWVSVPRLAREALMSERTAYRVIDALLTKGLIGAETRPGKTTLYTIAGIRTPDTMSPRVSRVPLTNPALTPDKNGPTPDTWVADEPALEPKEEPAEIESLYARANKVASLYDPEPETPDLLKSFPRMFARQAEIATARPPSPAAQAEAHRLARDFGDAACIEIATDYDWKMHPNYLRSALVQRQAAASAPVAAISTAPRRKSDLYDE